MTLSPEQKQTYLATGGIRCPLCGSDDLDGEFTEINAGGATQRVSCMSCHQAWTDVYRLIDVEPDDSHEAGSATSLDEPGPAPAKPPDLTIVVSGGNVQAVYAPDGLTVQLIDFDNLKEGDPFEPHEYMSPDGPPDDPQAIAVRAEAVAVSAQNQLNSND